MNSYDNWKLTVPPKKPMPQCPVCGSEAKEFYRLDGKIIGCDACVETVDAAEWRENHG